MKSEIRDAKLEEPANFKVVSSIYLIPIFIISFFFLSESCFGQCEMKFEYEVESIKNINSIKLIAHGTPPFNCAIYNLETDENVRITIEKEKKILFKDLRKGSYAIRLRDFRGCKAVKEVIIK